MRNHMALGRLASTLGIGIMLAALAAGVSIAADQAENVSPAALLAKQKVQYHRPSSIPFPAANPFTVAKVKLGRILFFDPRLSGSNTISCATCHNPGFGWQDGMSLGVGFNSKQLGRATPTILDLAWTDLLMWDGRKDGLEEQATGPISSAAEMNLPLDNLAAKLSAIPRYRRLFQEAFGDATITVPVIARAIATFERTIVSGKAPFDRWIDGDETAIGVEAKRGFTLFAGRGNCAACHSGWRFTDDGFHDIGLKSQDMGRGAQVPGEPMLEHAFKTPTLRNIASRGPYMHDGSIQTLREVIVHYDTGFIDRASLSPEMRRLALSEQDVNDLLAFMYTLTSEDEPVAVPSLPAKEEGS